MYTFIDLADKLPGLWCIGWYGILGLQNNICNTRVPTPPGKSWVFSWKFQDLEIKV